MLIFAFDAGGDDNTEHLTVAGFASSTEDWNDFSEKWKARLEKDRIAFFRAADAASFRGPFDIGVSYQTANNCGVRSSGT